MSQRFVTRECVVSPPRAIRTCVFLLRTLDPPGPRGQGPKQHLCAENRPRDEGRRRQRAERRRQRRGIAARQSGLRIAGLRREEGEGRGRCRERTAQLRRKAQKGKGRRKRKQVPVPSVLSHQRCVRLSPALQRFGHSARFPEADTRQATHRCSLDPWHTEQETEERACYRGRRRGPPPCRPLGS